MSPSTNAAPGRLGRGLPAAKVGTWLSLVSILGVPDTSVRAQESRAVVDTSAQTALLRAVRQTSPELTARRATLGAAEARLRAASVVAPLRLAADLEEVPGGFDVAAAGSIRLEVSREFAPSGLSAARRALAQADVDQARVALETAERSLVVRTELLLVRAAASILIARRLAAEDSLLSGAEESIRTRFAVGDARYVDVLRLRTERLRIQTDLAAALSEAGVHRRVLTSLVTSDGDPKQGQLVDSAISSFLRPAEAAGVLWSPLSPSPEVDSLVQNSGAVRLAVVELGRADAARRVSQAERRSQMSASVGAQRFERNEGGHTVGPTIGFSVSLPFTARSANSAATYAAEREVEAARTRARLAEVSARMELVTARARYEAVRERLALFDVALLRGAREERETALASYRSGELSLLELLDFERALARAEIAQFQGRLEAADALADLLAGASGGIELSGLPADHSPRRPEGIR